MIKNNYCSQDIPGRPTDDTLNREVTGKGTSASHRAADFQFGAMAFENVFDNR